MKYRVYYQRFFGLLRPEEVQGKWLPFTHRFVKEVDAESLDEVFRHMQGENWSAHGEAWLTIAHLNLSHTSMSVGDMLADPTGHYWICNDLGWLPLPYESFQLENPLSSPAVLWMSTEASFTEVHPQVTRIKITSDLDGLPPDAYTLEQLVWLGFEDLVALAKLIEQRLGLSVCIDLGEQFYETDDEP